MDPLINPARIALWGTSFSGGHVQVIAAEDRRVAAAIAQVPFADGWAVARAAGFGLGVRLALAADRDLARAALGRREYRVRVFGPPGSVAAMTTPGAEEIIRAKLMPPGEWDETMPARTFASLPLYRPGRHARRIACPILFQIAERDRVTPPGPALRAAGRAPRAEVERYPIDHFDVYDGAPFERAVGEQIEFLKRNL